MSAAPSDVAQLLRHFRTRSGLTQEALAEIAGLSAQAISVLENGRRRHPRPVTIDLLTAALNLSPSDREALEHAAARRSDAPSLTQLPPAISDFTGRTRQLTDLEELLRSPYAASPGVVISAIGGMGGVGKTTLAVQAAHQVADEFPDGQLYLNLRGGGGKPLSTKDALDALLQALGLPPARSADDQEVTAARYRSALAGRRMLLLLDDAVSVAQVRPLMPGTAGTAVVITSRQHLSALAGVRRVDLDVLTEPEALQLLGEVLGHDLLEKEPDAAREVVRRCGYLPLAIRIASQAGRAAGSLESLAAELTDETGRRELLTSAGAGVGRSILVSLLQLERDGRSGDAAAAKAFPVLAVFDGPHFPLRAAAKVMGRAIDETEELLERLVDIHLLETPVPQLYRMHDLVHDVGRALALAEFTESARADFRSRELDCYLGMVWRLDDLVGRPDLYGTRVEPLWSAGAEDVTELEDAAGWLRDELPNLVRLIRTAAGGDATDQLLAVRMALGMPRVAVVLMRFGEAHEAIAAVVGIAPDLEPRLAAGLLYQMGFMDGCFGLHDDAGGWLQMALPVARGLEDPVQLAVCLIDLGYNLARIGRPSEGLSYVEEGLALVKSHQIHSFEVSAYVALGAVAGLLGDIERQQAAFDQALLLTPTRTAVGPASVHRRLIGRSLRETGQLEASLEVLTGGLAGVRAANLELAESDLLLDLGNTWLGCGGYAKAHEVLTAGLEIVLRYPADHREPALRHCLGQALAGLGRQSAARSQWQQALTKYQQAADPRAEEVVELLASLGGEA